MAGIQASAQKYDYLWRHGSYSQFYPDFRDFVVDFHTFPPAIIPLGMDTTIFLQGSGITMCNKEGKVVFFSNGCSLFTADDHVMEDGEVLNPGKIFDVYCKKQGYYPIYQGMFFIHLKDNIYRVFHQRQDDKGLSGRCTYPDILYSTVDMDQNGGQGKVIESNVELFHGCPQVLCANRHANGRDWWLLLASNESDAYYRYLLTPDTILGPWIQQIENPARDTSEYYGWSDFSQDGQKFVNTHFRAGIAVYDFDRCTGLLSNLRYVPRASNTVDFRFASIFSPNGRFLYSSVGYPARVDQFDLTAPDLVASRKTVEVWDGTKDEFGHNILFHFFQHGPDGKIYIWSFSRYIHVIDYPDRAGLACHVGQRAIKLPSPAFDANFYYPHYRLGPLDGSSCDTLGINNLPHAEYRYDLSDSTQAWALQFTDVSWYEPDHWHWDFNDPASGGSNTSLEQNPVHTFSQSGTYTVCLIASNQYAADTICKEVKVGISSSYALPALPQAQVYPNPVTDALMVSLPALLPGHQLYFTLTDALGRTVRKITLSDFETELNMADLPKGIYFWKIRSGWDILQTGKVVKM